MNSNFFFSLSSIQPQHHNEAGSLAYITAKDTPGLVNISFCHLKLNPHGSLEPIWHPNAHKLGYCTRGKALVEMRTPSSTEVFTLQKGEMFFIPQGYVHRLENIGEEECEVGFTLNHTNPETMRFSDALFSISNTVFDSTFQTNSTFFDGLKRTKNQNLLKLLPTTKNVPFISSRYKFDIEESSKTIATKGGYLQFGLKGNLQVLEGLGILGFGLNPKGIVEPHWHTNAGELVYIVKGKTRITILSPDGHTQVLEVSGGEGAFAPASHFHHIENIGLEDAEVIAFFSHAEPDYIGIGEVMGSYSDEVLASIFNVSPNYFESFKKPTGPLVIVPV